MLQHSYVMQLSKMSRNFQNVILKIKAKQSRYFFFFCNQNAIYQEPIAQYPWGFQQIKP